MCPVESRAMCLSDKEVFFFWRVVGELTEAQRRLLLEDAWMCSENANDLALVGFCLMVVLQEKSQFHQKQQDSPLRTVNIFVWFLLRKMMEQACCLEVLLYLLSPTKLARRVELTKHPGSELVSQAPFFHWQLHRECIRGDTAPILIWTLRYGDRSFQTAGHTFGFRDHHMTHFTNYCSSSILFAREHIRPYSNWAHHTLIEPHWSVYAWFHTYSMWSQVMLCFNWLNNFSIWLPIFGPDLLLRDRFSVKTVI